MDSTRDLLEWLVTLATILLYKNVVVDHPVMRDDKISIRIHTNIQGLTDLENPIWNKFYPYHFFVSALVTTKLQKIIIFWVHKNLNISELQR